MFGSLLFSYAFGSGFDRNVKEWRLFADLSALSRLVRTLPAPPGLCRCPPHTWPTVITPFSSLSSSALQPPTFPSSLSALHSLPKCYCHQSPGLPPSLIAPLAACNAVNDVGLTLDMLAPLMPSPSSFALLAAAGAACKSICGTVAGACRSSVTAHFALSSNLADVSAKEGAQETAVTLVGLVVGSWLATQLGDSQAIPSRHTCLSVMCTRLTS